MEIVPLTINQISDRGALFINDTLVINSRSTAIDFPQKFNGWATHGPIVDFDTLSHKYRLEDLRIPYILSKRAHCDTIYVIKDGHELKFFLEEFE